MNDTDRIRLANLEAVADMRRAEMLAVFKPLAASVAKVINDAVAASGYNKYAVAVDKDGDLRDIEWINVEGEDDGERLIGIDISFRRKDYNDSKRVFSFGTCAFGNVKAGDRRGIAYCTVIGHLAAHAQEIDDALNAIPEWKAYDSAYRIWCISRSDAEALAKQIKDEEAKEARAKVEERLVVGAEIAVTYNTKWDCEKCDSVVTGVHTMTVEKVTKKLVFFAGHFRQYKKDEVCAAIVNGIDKGGWSFASDIDMTQFPCPSKH